MSSDAVADAVYERRKTESIPWFGSPLRYGGNTNDEVELLQDKHEASTIELFYDLFFVANLCIFTKGHEINDGKSLRSYVGFFTFIWFTWLQVSFFDVRFARDSIFERICKTFHFAVMIGFAAVGSHYEPNLPGDHYMTLRTIGFIMFGSRLVNAAQYFLVLVDILRKRYMKAVLPMLLIITVLLCSAFLSLGITLSFKRGVHSRAYKIWYASCVVEAALVIGVSLWKTMLSFKHSNLVERLGLLTLIVLGEGIIGLSKNSNKIVQHEGWTSSTAAEIAAYVLTIYFLWMIYFDNHPRSHYGTIREQIWALFHFPLHIFLVLLPEGLGQFVIWRSVLTKLRDLEDDMTLALTGVSHLGQSLQEKMNVTITDTLTMGTKKFHADKFEGVLMEIGQARTAQQANAKIQKLMDKGAEYIFGYFGVQLPHWQKYIVGDKRSKLEQFFDVFLMIYEYFFIGGAVVLFLLAFFLFLVRKKRDGYDWASIVYRIVGGVIFLILGLLSKQRTLIIHFMTSIYVVPIVPGVFGIIILLDRLTMFIAIKRASRGPRKNRRHQILHPAGDPSAPRASIQNATFEYSNDSIYPTMGSSELQQAKAAASANDDDEPYKEIALTPMFAEKFSKRSAQLIRKGKGAGGRAGGDSDNGGSASDARAAASGTDTADQENLQKYIQSSRAGKRQSSLYRDTLTAPAFPYPSRASLTAESIKNPYADIIAKAEQDKEDVQRRAIRRGGIIQSAVSSIYSLPGGPGAGYWNLKRS